MLIIDSTFKHISEYRTEYLEFTCLDSCSDSGGGCDAQSLLAKVDHGLIAPLFGLHNILIYFLQGDINNTFLVDRFIERHLV